MLRYVVAVLIAAVAVLIATQDTPPMVSPITSETLPRKSIEMLRLGLAFGFGALSEALMPEKLRLLHLHFGFVDTQAFHVFATLEVADAMHEGLDTASALAARVGADETRLEQVLQYLAARGVIVHIGRTPGESAAATGTCHSIGPALCSIAR